MSITVRCHSCDKRHLCSDESAGKTVRCKACRAEMRVPSPPAAVPDWQAAPPPVRRLEAALAPVADEPEAAPEEDGAPAEPEVFSYEAPEPWFYGFIEKYTLSAMWGAIVACTLPFVGLTLFLLALGTGLVGVGIADAGEHSTGPGVLFGGGALFVAWLAALLAYVLTILAIMFTAALFLLAVDAGRTLRALHAKRAG